VRQSEFGKEESSFLNIGGREKGGNLASIIRIMEIPWGPPRGRGLQQKNDSARCGSCLQAIVKNKSLPRKRGFQRKGKEKIGFQLRGALGGGAGIVQRIVSS